MTQTLEFHPAKADLAKTRGMTLAAENRADLLETAREVALWLGRKGAAVTIDDVMKGIAVYNFEPHELGNAAGSVFVKSQWTPVGYTKSTRVSNHSRIVRLWVRK